MNLPRLPALLLPLVLVLAGCGGGGSGGGGDNSPDPDPDPGSGPGVRNAVCASDMRSMPGSPPRGETRNGLICEINIPSPINPTQTIAFQVFEPRTLTGGQKYPLVLEGHGFGGSRQTDESNSSGLGVGPITRLRNSGYGVISVDQAGHGESGGTIRVMDPDQEGRFMLAIVDWLEANLDWYAVGPDLDAGTSNMVLGAIGLSYGGGYQLMLQAIDPKKRLDAIVPQITWNDLTYSLNPGDVIKANWALFLFLGGQVPGGGGNFDPFVNSTFVSGFTTNRISQEGKDFFRYHGLGYFCDGIPVATNGGIGTRPLYAPTAPTGVHALLFQGFRDTLFNFNEAWRSYECLNGRGGDVRLLTYQAGHNGVPVVPDVPALFGQPFAGASDFSCGNINADTATVAWFDEYLKGIPGAANAALGNTEVCYSLEQGDAVVSDRVIAGTAGTEFSVSSTPKTAGLGIVGTPIPLYTAPAAGAIMAGVPRVEVDLTGAEFISDPTNVIVFVGTARTRFGVWELADNQVQPLRGIGRHTVNLPGIGERLAPGDQAGIILYGLNSQYLATGSLNLPAPVIAQVRLGGRAWLPLLSPQLPAAP